MNWQIAVSCFAGVSPILVVLLGLHLQNRRTMRLVITHWKEFPPHRHVNGHLIFPAGMDPDASLRRSS
jgi:hypothetical protein